MSTSRFIWAATLLGAALGCRIVDVASNTLGHLRFHQVPLEAANGTATSSRRPGNSLTHSLTHSLTYSLCAVYFSETNEGEREYYLYHTRDSYSGIGRWVINDVIERNTALVSFISHTILYFVHALIDNRHI